MSVDVVVTATAFMDITFIGLERLADEAPVEVLAERDRQRGLKTQPRGPDRVDGAAAGRADEVAGEALLARSGHGLEPDERQVHERGRGDDDVDAHAKRSASSGRRLR